MINRSLVEKLMELGPEQVVDGFGIMSVLRRLSLGIAIDGETVIHCPVCHDQNAVTAADADRWRHEMAERYGQPRNA